jgi:hypothetical protein
MRHLRLVAAILVALGLVLPLSMCTKGDPPTTEYHWVVGDALDNSSCDSACAVTAIGAAVLALLWPLGAVVASRTQSGRRPKVIRMCVELLLLGGSAWWLHWQLLVEKPAAGAFAAFAGFSLYGAIWLTEVVSTIRDYKPASEART